MPRLRAQQDHRNPKPASHDHLGHPQKPQVAAYSSQGNPPYNWRCVPTILMVKGWRVFFYSNTGTEPMHVYVRKRDAEACHPSYGERSGKSSSNISTAVIPWENCSPRLATAEAFERAIAKRSPSGYGIHWPLLDEDLAVGPLLTR